VERKASFIKPNYFPSLTMLYGNKFMIQEIKSLKYSSLHIRFRKSDRSKAPGELKLK
jgi:hypothetical protein